MLYLTNSSMYNALSADSLGKGIVTFDSDEKYKRFLPESSPKT